MREVSFARPVGEGMQCLLCPHVCRLTPGEKGLCGVRQNRDNKIIALNYLQVGAWAIDPIEKKPLYHFYPGSIIFSVGSPGCNLECGFCQNWSLARGHSPAWEVSAEELISLGRREGSVGIAFTYAEPLMWYETLEEIMPEAQDQGLKMILVTNGFINSRPLKRILPFVDAVNLDLKAFRNNSYEKHCRGNLTTILHSAELFNNHCHLEITTLIVPGINDDPEEIGEEARWIRDNLGEDTPLHLSRYFPAYKYTHPPVSLKAMMELYQVARDHLPYVYLGNVHDAEYSTTRCPSCGHTIVQRFPRISIDIHGRECPSCGHSIPITNSGG